MMEVDPPGQPLRNARRFVDARYGRHGHRLLVHQGGVFYEYDGTCWPTVDDADLRAELYEHFDDAVYDQDGEMKPFAPNRYKVADLLDALRGFCHLTVTTPTPSWLVTAEALDANSFIACSNGLVRVPSRSLFDHTPNFYTHHAVDFAFSTKAPPPQRWLTFLDELWPGDAESIATVQELLGYLVSGDTRLQKMFLLVGPKRSGKGTIARIIKALLGAHNVAGPTLASLGTNFGLSPLIGKPVAIIADARLNTKDTSIVTERLLSISGEDTLTVDRKYKEPWTGQIPARILVLSNELPRLTDSSGALASRFVVLTTTVSFYGKENPELTAQLMTELPGIFNWALDGLERLRQRGYFLQPKASQDAIRDLEDLGSPVGAFVRDECVVGAAESVDCDTLYSSWKTWCEERGRRASNSQILGRDLRAAFPLVRVSQPRRDGARHREYHGVGLARSGTRSTPMYPQRQVIGADRGRSSSTANNNGDARVPSRANGFCRACDGEGCKRCDP
jgi:putative DNA primase/helicase